MRNLKVLVPLMVIAVGCDPQITHTAAPTQVVANFDPGANPPVVPTPNDLATDPTTGLLVVPPPPNASAADIEFAAYLSTLNGFPSDTPAQATFTGASRTRP